MVLDYKNGQDRELQFLLKLTSFSISSINELEEDIDWERLFKIAIKHKVAMLAYSRLKPHEKSIPKRELSKFEEYNKQRLLSNLQNIQHLLKLHDVASEEGIEIIPYKGALFAHEVYGSIALRESSDIDFWFSLEEKERLFTIFEKLGFRYGKPKKKWHDLLHQEINCEYHFVKYEKGLRILVEPHYNLTNHFLKIPLSISEIAPHIQKVDFSGRQIKTFSPSLMLLYLVTHHGATEGWHKLKNYTDLAAFIQRYQTELNWNDMLKLCGYYKVKRLAVIGILNACCLYKINVPTEVDKIATPEIQKHASMVLSVASKMYESKKRGIYKIWLLWVTRESFIDKCQLVVRILYYSLMRMVYAVVVR